MKFINLLGTIALTILLINCSNSKQATAQTKEATFFVDGVCGMCKERIENAAYMKGVKKADWNLEEKKLTVVYVAEKTSPDVIMKSLAAAGHDNEKYKATDEDYEKKIHTCCKYRELKSH